MAENHATRLHNQPLRLLRNVTYPTYQLYALAGRGKAPPATVLTICVLQTLAWLRNRFRDFEAPDELKWPEPDAYAEVDPHSFKSFRIDHGYKVEVVWLPDEQVWTMQLTEPDLGSDPGAARPKRAPVPGRLFETNIAYRVLTNDVECGFRTVVSDVEGITVPCEVYRLAFIKHLARHPLVGLNQFWPLQEEPHVLETVAAIRQLQEWLKDKSRMMPAVVVAACALEPSPQPLLPSFDEVRQSLQGLPGVHGRQTLVPMPALLHAEPMPHLEPRAVPLPENDPSVRLKPDRLLDLKAGRGTGHRGRTAAGAADRSHVAGRAGKADHTNVAGSAGNSPVAAPGSDPVAGLVALTTPAVSIASAAPATPITPFEPWPPFIAELAHYKMGYAQFFLLPLNQFAAFRKHTNRMINAGDILVIDPLAFGGEVTRFAHQRLLSAADTLPAMLDELLQNYPKNKPMAFGRVVFLAEAKEMERSRTIASVQSREELLRASDERAQAAEARHREELRAREEHLAMREDKIRRQEDKIRELEEDKALLRQAQGDTIAAHEVELAARDAVIQRLRSQLERPADLEGIPEWVRRHLGDGLVFHSRAEREITAASPSDVNIPLLCDALEFLATDFRTSSLA